MVVTHMVWVCVGLLSVAPQYLAEPNIYSHLSSTSVLPSPVKYFKQDGDQVAMETEPPAALSPDNRVDGKQTADRAQQARLGFPMYSSTSLSHGYSGTSPGVYSPVKLDLGGLLLGTVVGLGAVLLIPKILHIFTGHSSYGHYARDGDSVTSGMTDIIARVDRAISAQHVNTTSCMQRAFCALVQYSSPDSGSDQSENFISAATRNPVVSFLMEGSRLQEAVAAGQAGQSCSTSFPQCPITPEIVATGLHAALQSL